MNIHEYQGKEIFRRHGVPVPMGVPAFSVDEAEAAAKKIIAETGNQTVVVKAQIHAGGRGKGGGVKVVKGADGARDAASKLLGMTLVTKQTGPAGKKVKRLFVEQGLAIDHEYYLALVVDRETRRIAVMTSYEGGMDIEEVAAKTPEKILRETIDPTTGFMPYHGRKLAYGLGLRGAPAAAFGKLVGSLYGAFVAEDCSLVEINPLVTTKDGHVIALDAKINFDDNGEFRHPEWEQLHDPNEENPAEARAKEVGLNYVDLDGNIGCLVNGAGLAMATMDVIKYAGGEPANFLDVGGGATKEQVTNAFKIILTSPEVQGIFVNIFGGIMRCDIIAEGVVAATKELGLKIPAVVRLEGTNVEMGRKILSESGLALTTAGTMLEGAQKIVALVKGK